VFLDQHDHPLPTRWVHLLSLREDVHVETEPADGAVVLNNRWGEVSLGRPGGVVREMLRRMSLGPISLENAVPKAELPPAERTELHEMLERLQYLVVRSFGLPAGVPLISVVPLAPGARFRPVKIAPELPVRLSRFAWLRTDGQGYYLESPLSLHRVVLHRAEAVALIGALGSSTTPAAAAAAVRPSGLPVAEALSYLVAAGMVVQAAAADSVHLPTFAEDTDPALATWSSVDLMFHTRSTLGRHDNDFGATYPQGRRDQPEPVVKPRRAVAAGIELHRPKWENLLDQDPPLTAAIEGRRSQRDYGGTPMTANELGELLYRTARLRSLVSPAGAESPRVEWSDRPYPTGGACHELEFYVTVHECGGVPRGVYHYDPRDHVLEPLGASTVVVDELLESGRLAANLGVPPPVLITMTARFRRISWKYSGLGYAMTIKDVGVAMQTLYLVCAAMGLASCALGAGDIELTARAFGTDWRTESSVGEFVVGSRPATVPATDPELTNVRTPVNDATWRELALTHLPPGADPTAARDGTKR
jgi:SagB-type dehydrogenase family enzyme